MADVNENINDSLNALYSRFTDVHSAFTDLAGLMAWDDPGARVMASLMDDFDNLHVDFLRYYNACDLKMDKLSIEGEADKLEGATRAPASALAMVS